MQNFNKPTCWWGGGGGVPFLGNTYMGWKDRHDIGLWHSVVLHKEIPKKWNLKKYRTSNIIGKNKWMEYINLQDWPSVRNSVVEETGQTSQIEEEYVYVDSKIQIFH